VVNALAKAGINLGDNGSVIPKPHGKPCSELVPELVPDAVGLDGSYWYADTTAAR